MAIDKLTSTQQKAIASLLSQPTIKQAAEIAGVGERTLHRWLVEDTAFDAAYRKARRAAVQQATARLQQVSTAAVVVLTQLMTDKNAPANVRRAAARDILEMSLRAVELDDLAARVAVLETMQEKQHGS